MPSTNAELKFKEWLDQKGYGYLYIDQSAQTFSEFFRGIIKRPDFLVVLNRIGIIAVDVKERNMPFDRHGAPCVTLDEEEEVNKYLAFERLMRVPVWFVFYIGGDYSIQRWVPLSKVFECERETSEKGPFRIIRLEDCIILQTNRDSISRIID
mgnify:CR=1 FL=1